MDVRRPLSAGSDDDGDDAGAEDEGGGADEEEEPRAVAHAVLPACWLVVVIRQCETGAQGV